MRSSGGEGAEFRQRTAASGVVAFVARTAQSFLALGSAVIMARLLTPGDFGVFAMVMPLGVLGMIAANHCTQAAFLQHPIVDDGDLQGFYRFARSVAWGAAIVMCVLSLGLAWFYDEPRVPAVTAAMAVVVALMTRGAVQEARLKHALRFPMVHAVQLTTWTIGLLTGLIAAWLGAGYWALPLQVIVMELVRIIAINHVSEWRPGRDPGVAGPRLTELRRAWRSLFALRIASWINEQPDLVAIGRLGGSVVLGSYDTARRWAWYAFEEPYLALTEVAIASLGRVRDDPVRFRHLVTRFILAMLTVSLPIVAFVGVEAASVVRVLLGEQWTSAVPFLRVLGIAAFAGIIRRTSTWILLARGGTDRLLRWSLLYQAPATIVAVVVGLAWGAMGIAIAMAVLSVVQLIPAIAYVVRGTSVRLRDVLRAAARPAGASLIAALAIGMSAGFLPPAAGISRFAASLGVYVLSFVAAWLALPGGLRDTADLVATVKGLARRGDRAPTGEGP